MNSSLFLLSPRTPTRTKRVTLTDSATTITRSLGSKSINTTQVVESISTLTPQSIPHSNSPVFADVDFNDVDPDQLAKVLEIHHSDSDSHNPNSDEEDSVCNADILQSPSLRKRRGGRLTRTVTPTDITTSLPLLAWSGCNGISSDEDELACQHRDRIKRRYLGEIGGPATSLASDTDTDTEVQRYLTKSRIDVSTQVKVVDISTTRSETDTDTEVQRYLSSSSSFSQQTKTIEGTSKSELATPSPKMAQYYYNNHTSDEADSLVGTPLPLPLPSYTNFRLQNQQHQTPPSLTKDPSGQLGGCCDLKLNRGLGPVIADPISPSSTIRRQQPRPKSLIRPKSQEVLSASEDMLVQNLLSQNQALELRVLELQNELNRYRGR